MNTEILKDGKFVLTNKETGEETELQCIGNLEIKGTSNDSIYNNASFLTTPVSGTLKFQKIKAPGFKEARRLFNILNHVKKTRTKKKLFNRIYATTAGKLYSHGIGVNRDGKRKMDTSTRKSILQKLC